MSRRSICEEFGFARGAPIMRPVKLGLLLIALGVGAAACGQGMSVIVSNGGAEPLTDVILKYRKDGNEVAARVGTIQRGESSKRVNIVFDSESFLRLSFIDAHGVIHDAPIDIYLENVHEPITLHVLPSLLVRCDGSCGNWGRPAAR